jgi:hypothetical protein
MATLFVDKVDPQSGTSLEIGSSGDTITTATGAKPSFNYPAFEAYSAATQNLTSATDTLVIFGTEVFDTNNNFASNRFTPTVAGKYFVYSSLSLQSTDYTMYNTISKIYKNGSNYKASPIISANTSLYAAPITLSAIIDMNGSSDYVEMYAYMELHSGSVRRLQPETKGTYFGAYRIGT